MPALGAASQEDTSRAAILSVVNPVSRSRVQSDLQHAAADSMAITRIAAGQPLQGCGNARTRCGVECPKPGTKRAEAVRRQVLRYLGHNIGNTFGTIRQAPIGQIESQW